MILNDVVNLFFPKVCFACSDHLSDNERDFCTNCRHLLPTTSFHLEKPNEVEKVFYGRVKLEMAASFLRFEKKGTVQQLLHNLKYRGQEKIGQTLGTWYAEELKQSEYFKDIDVIIPVPLHKKRLRERGYNQVAMFAKEIATALNTEYIDDVLTKVSSVKTQVFKNRLSRWSDANTIFSLNGNSEKIVGKHILLIDDIIVSGGTAFAAANLIKKLNVDLVEMCFLMNIQILDGKKKLEKVAPVYSVLDV